MKKGIRALICRIILAITIALCLNYISVETDRIMNSTLLTVISVFYSMVMSLFISFNMDKIKNIKLRNALKELISNAMITTTIDFCICIFLYMLQYDNIIPIETVYLSLSIFFMIMKLFQLHKLQQDIADEIFKEEQANE